MKLRTPIALVLITLFTFSTIIAQSRYWHSVRTNHLFVIGDADQETLRRVAIWLEYFHSAFARVVSRNPIESATPTTVIVFRDNSSFEPFLPVYQGRVKEISGFFLSGDDVNYIALSLDPRNDDPFRTAFHEYVHLHTNDNIPDCPLWLNEGLAEVYASLQFSGSEVLIGAPNYVYLYLLRRSDLLPLKTLFSIDTSSPHYNEQLKAGIFYGESWALVHYLMLGDRSRQDQFKQFLQRVASGDDAARAIESTYGITLDQLQQELELYVRRGNLNAQRITGAVDPRNYGSYTATQRSTLTRAEAVYYLADLALHLERTSVAERGFKEAISQDPDFLPAHAALGVMYVRQRRYEEAKKYLQKATSAPQSYEVHYLYAYVLSREGISATGELSHYSRDNVVLMRNQLLQSIKLAPNYAPSHYLLAVVDFVSGDRLDEAFEMAQKALRLSPSDKNYAALVDDIKRFRGDNTSARERGEPIKSDPIAEPERTETSRMLGGESGPVAINDGGTVDNSGSLPAIDEIINKYQQAAGGAATVKAINTRIVKGSVDVVGVSRGGTFETYFAAPNKALSIMKTTPTGMSQVGYNGSVGWVRMGGVVRTLKSSELDWSQSEADFYGILNLRNKYPKMALRGKSKIGYREVYVIDLRPGGDRLFVDAETFLPVRLNTSRIEGGVASTVEIYYDDWRPFEGLFLPYTITFSYGKRTMMLTVQEIQNNVPVDAKIFEQPL